MKAVLCEAHGPAENLVIRDLPEPEAGFGEVVVDVAAIGLNFFDTLIIRDRYQVKPDLPFSPGGEFAGHVRAVGPGVTEWAVGDRVAGYLSFGAARERLVVPAESLARVPDGLDFVKAAGLTVTYGTGLYALRDRGGLQPGETLVVLGAAGGVGLAAVELGKALGARVIACASSAEKLAFAKAHGADEGIDYTTENFKGRLKALGGEAGIDMVFDPVGGDLSEVAVRALNSGGRLMVIGFAAGDIPKLPLNLLLLKNCDARGVAFGTKCRTDPAWCRAAMEDLMGHALSGRLSGHVDATFPLERCAEALAEISQRRVKGKVVLTAGA
ncbi:NADPH:quinone oxidoreductase family protein [Aquabacter cavernae]|uniref:NADPH:quinone oxidoreductase family protein n=1 Tax=Aquabacter cavernae TaxID=2496029 RepID=UPI000F8F1C90|nr:NADPH:quinone oxidoreductase family protein [Aquabacter cavernae]